MKNLIARFRATIIAVFCITFLFTLLSFFDKDSLKLSLKTVCCLPVLLLLDFILWVLHYDEDDN